MPRLRSAGATTAKNYGMVDLAPGRPPAAPRRAPHSRRLLHHFLRSRCPYRGSSGEPNRPVKNPPISPEIFSPTANSLDVRIFRSSRPSLPESVIPYVRKAHSENSGDQKNDQRPGHRGQFSPDYRRESTSLKLT